jgi:G3E family GTPase
MRVTLIFGFLGAGKTSLLTRLIDASPETEKLAVIVNEFGDVGVDGAIIEGRAIDTVELPSGCICCSLKGALIDAVDELFEEISPDRLLVEASGVALPADLRSAFERPGTTLGPIVSVVDAARFGVMSTALGPFYTEQIAAADIVIVNKVDLVDAGMRAAVRGGVSELAPSAAILFAESCDIDPKLVLEGEGGVGGDSQHHLHVDAQSIALDVPRPLAEDRLRAFFAALPETVWRAKGFVEIDAATRLLQHVPGQTELTGVARRDNHYLVFIGATLDESALENGLEACVSASSRGAL